MKSIESLLFDNFEDVCSSYNCWLFDRDFEELFCFDEDTFTLTVVDFLKVYWFELLKVYWFNKESLNRKFISILESSNLSLESSVLLKIFSTFQTVSRDNMIVFDHSPEPDSIVDVGSFF